MDWNYHKKTYPSDSGISASFGPLLHILNHHWHFLQTHLQNSTKSKWRLSSMHSGTLSLSHCKMLRISGESVSNHHGQVNDSNTKQEDARRSCISRNGICSFIHWCKLNQDRVDIVKHALRNAIVVSPQDAQNQRGKRFKSSRANQRLKHQARRCKKIMHISKWDLIIYTPVQTQPRQGE